MEMKLVLDAMNTLQNAYMAFNRPLAVDDIEDIADKAGIPYDIPGSHDGGPHASDSGDLEYTQLSSTGL